MPGPAMAPSRRAIRTTMRRTITHRMIMAITVITVTSIIMMSIVIMIITTAIPMLMTTSKPPTRPRRSKMARAGTASEAAVRPTGHRKGMDAADAATLYRLMTWLSPSFPVGAFSYSSGIEWAVETGDISDAASLRDWLSAMLADGP
jgi:urease accessory protein